MSIETVVRDITDTDALSLIEQIEVDFNEVNKFCEVYKTEVTRIVKNTDSEVEEVAYFFNDGLGAYSMDAIRKSLYENKE
jgi:fructose-specific phosphotransferase system component IIB